MAAPSIRAYVKRTILAAAREHYARRRANNPAGSAAEDRKAALISAFSGASRGTYTGWWGDLTYTAPMLAMAYRYRESIREVLQDTGTWAAMPVTHGGPTFGDLIAATSDQWDRDDEAALLGLRMAVEIATDDLASEMGVEPIRESDEMVA